MKTILLANHSESVRTAQKDLLIQNGYKVIGEAADVTQIVEKVKKLTPDLLVMGFDPYYFDSLEALKEIRHVNKEVKLIISSQFPASSPLVELIRLGARDWISESFPLHSERFIQGVRTVLE